MRGEARRRGRLRTPNVPPWVRTLAVLWFAQVIAEMAFSFALPFVPLYLQDLGITDVDRAGLWAGAMAGGFGVVMGLMGPVWGMVADRYGRRLMILRALFGACVVIGAMGFVQSAEQLFVLRLLQGSVTGVVAATTTVVSLSVPKVRLASALGMMHGAMFAGSSLGPIVGGLVADRFGYRAAFVVTGLLFLVAGILVVLFVHEPARTDADAPGKQVSLVQSMRDTMALPGVIMVIVLMSLLRVATVAPQPILPLFVQVLAPDRLHLATIAGSVLAGTSIASTVSAMTIGPLADRFGRRRVLLVVLAAATLLGPPHLFVTELWQLAALRVAVGLALGGLVPIVQTLLTDLTPSERRGMAFGLLATAGAVGNGAGPVLAGVLAAAYGAPLALAATTPVFVFGLWQAGRRRGTALFAGRSPGHVP